MASNPAFSHHETSPDAHTPKKMPAILTTSQSVWEHVENILYLSISHFPKFYPNTDKLGLIDTISSEVAEEQINLAG